MIQIICWNKTSFHLWKQQQVTLSSILPS
jgi:hypothetical protein